MLTIIEGVDETGKTTLARQFGGRYVHFGPPSEKGPLYDYTKELARTSAPTHTTIDRFHWGEQVYGPEYRGESGIDDAQRYWLDLVIGGRGGVIVLCFDAPEAIYQRVTSADDDFVRHDLTHLKLLQEKFLTLTRNTALPVYGHSVQRPLDPYAVKWGDITRNYLATSGHFISTPQPSVLLVGDEPGNGDPVERAFPFYPGSTNCGHYLMDALLKTGLWGTVMITNSLHPDGSPIDIDRLYANTASLRSVVALGRKASERIAMPHGVVYHPQYARRFHYHDNAGYAAALYAAAHTGVDTTEGGFLGN